MTEYRVRMAAPVLSDGLTVPVTSPLGWSKAGGGII